MFGKEISLADSPFSACRCVALVATALLISAANLAGAVKAAEGDTIRIGVVVFLSGPAAESVGVPARQGLELMIDAINGGGLPAPFDTPGVGGSRGWPMESLDGTIHGWRQVRLRG